MITLKSTIINKLPKDSRKIAVTENYITNGHFIISNEYINNSSVFTKDDNSEFSPNVLAAALNIPLLSSSEPFHSSSTKKGIYYNREYLDDIKVEKFFPEHEEDLVPVYKTPITFRGKNTTSSLWIGQAPDLKNPEKIENIPFLFDSRYIDNLIPDVNTLMTGFRDSLHPCILHIKAKKLFLLTPLNTKVEDCYINNAIDPKFTPDLQSIVDHYSDSTLCNLQQNDK